MKKHQPSDSQLKIRLSSHELERFKSLAKKRGLSLTELVQLRIRNKPLPDRNWEKDLQSVISEFVMAGNRVGDNIDQVKLNLHILRRRREEPHPAMEEFNRLYTTYQECIDKLGRRLDVLQRS
jgi:hypothetical protein